MRILGQKCAFGATITHKKWSQSPQIIFIEFYSLILVGFHERITFFSLYRVEKVKKWPKCWLRGPYARSGPGAVRDPVRFHHFWPQSWILRVGNLHICLMLPTMKKTLVFVDFLMQVDEELEGGGGGDGKRRRRRRRSIEESRKNGLTAPVKKIGSSPGAWDIDCAFSLDEYEVWFRVV